MNDLSPKQRVFQMLASMAEIVGGSPDLNAERQHLATLIDHCRSWESELATKEADMRELQTFTLPAGTTCKRNGIPFKLQHATQIECHPENLDLILDGFVPSVDGQALSRNQPEQGLGIPQVAQSATKSETLEQILVEARAIRVKLEELHTLGSMVCWSGF